jgi:nitronate monooxygenase/enoyl-[acyl-carrier protein] reductase II
VLQTELCRRLAIELPIFNAGMGGGIAGAELAAAVSNAGGLGVLGALGLPPLVIREQTARIRSLTTKPFGVNLVIPQMTGGEIEACFEERIPVLVLFWGDPAPYVKDAHARGIKVILQAGSLTEAVAAAAAGVDVVMVQGVEAGGHVRGTESLLTLLPAAVDALGPLPVVAAGGVGDGRGVAAALALGAQAVSMGTRFLASDEAMVEPAYKERIVHAGAADTVYTSLFDLGWPDAPHRVLRNRAYTEWEAAGAPPSGQRPGEGVIVASAPLGGMTLDVPRYAVVAPVTGFRGDMDYVALYAGQSCELVHDIKPAAAIVRELAHDAAAALRREA